MNGKVELTADEVRELRHLCDFIDNRFSDVLGTDEAGAEELTCARAWSWRFNKRLYDAGLSTKFERILHVLEMNDGCSLDNDYERRRVAAALEKELRQG